MGFIKQVSLASVIAISLAMPSGAQEAPTADSVLATVNGTEIKLGHVISITSGLSEQYDGVDPAILFEGILDQLIQQSILEQGAQVSERRIKLALENERRSLVSSLEIAKLAEAAITDEAVQELYDTTIATGEPTPEYQASHILLDTEDEANAVLKLLNDGGNFAALAKEKSTGPSAPSGGDLGWFGRGAMVPEFDAAVAEMKVGEVAGPVKTQFGYHLIRLNDQRDYPLLEDNRAQLEEQIGTAAIKESIDKLQASATIEKITPTFDLSVIRNTSLLD